MEISFGQNYILQMLLGGIVRIELTILLLIMMEIILLVDLQEQAQVHLILLS